MVKPIAEIASGKMAAPFTQLSNMVLSHASEEGAAAEAKRRQTPGQVTRHYFEVDAGQAERQGRVTRHP